MKGVNDKVCMQRRGSAKIQQVMRGGKGDEIETGEQERFRLAKILSPRNRNGNAEDEMRACRGSCDV